eukprot:g21943.t1
MVSLTSGGMSVAADKTAASSERFHFENDIVPIFTKFGCNAGACHGKAEGQNGFKLSVFGYDPEADRKSLMNESRGRRVFPAFPEQSLFLRKISGGIPHGGGIRIRRDSAEYRTLRNWIAAGMPFGDADAPRIVSVSVTPSELQMKPGGEQQLRAIALFSDGMRKDVTRHAKFFSNNEGLANVDDNGLVTAGEVPGDAAIMVSYLGHVDVFLALIPRTGTAKEAAAPPTLNFIDRHVDAKLKKLNIVPSSICDDATFLRRVSLDLTGTLPTATEAKRFLADKRPNKRSLLVETLMKRPEFADYWAMKWADLLRVDRQALGHKGAYAFYRWIRQSVVDNKPYDQFVTELLTADGHLRDAPAGHFYKVVKKPGDVASALSQVLLGIRIECAQCHHHPFDRWTQSDYYGMTAYFTQVGFKNTPRGEMLTALRKTTTRHPRTRETINAYPLGKSNPPASPEGDRRTQLAAWMTAADNTWFAQNLVNRVWAHLMGRGLIEPVDDVRSTNPPSNPALLAAMSKDFIQHRFDFRHLIRRITASRTYQLTSATNATNVRDEQNYSRALFKRLDAEVLLDAVCQTTGVPEKFAGVPSGYRAIQLWDSHVPHDFLKLFGRPTRATACECERVAAPSVSQVLHVLNSPKIHGKLSHAGGRIAKIVSRFPADDSRVIDELYLTFYCRYPTKSERAAMVDLPVTINGRIFPREDVDVWRFTAKKGETIVCEVNAARIGSPLDSRLEVRGPNGRRIAENLDALGVDSRLSLIAPESGRYEVHIHDVNFGGLQSYVYRLTITAGPAVESVFPLGGRRGDAVTFQLTGKGLPKQTATVTLPKTKDAFCTHRFGRGPAKSQPVRLELSDLPEHIEKERQQATPVTAPAVLNGCIRRPGEVDIWAIRARKGDALLFDVRAARLGSKLDSVVKVVDSKGKQIATSDDIGRGQTDSQLKFKAPADGIYSIQVADRLSSRGGPGFGYRLVVTKSAVGTGFRLTLPDDAINVSRGQSTKVKLNVERLGGFRGEIALKFSNLPKGVTVAGDKVGKNKRNAQLVFESSDSSKIGVSRVRISGTATVDGKTIVVPVETAGESPQQEFWLAVAVPTPFKFTGVFETKYGSRGSVFTRHFSIDRGGYTGKLTVQLADIQARHLQGVNGPIIELPPDATEFDYPITLPPWMEIGRTSRTCLMLVGTVVDKDGTRHRVSYSSQAQNDQIIVLVDPGRLSVRLAERSVRAAPGKTVPITVHVARGNGLHGPVSVRLDVPSHLKGVRAEPVTIRADEKTATLSLRFDSIAGQSFNMPLTIRATLRDSASKRPYHAEAALSVAGD